MFGNAAPTQFDLRFSLLGIPVRVHPLFWLVSAVLGWDARDPNSMFLWVGCVFVSILVHELGHALTARAFGWNPEIVLYSLGGYASFLPTWGYTTGRAIVVLLAGPGAGFVLCGGVVCLWLLCLAQGWMPENDLGRIYVRAAFVNMIFINLIWGLVNLLPVYPLDGGQISRELCVWLWPRNGLEFSLKGSILVGAGIAILFLTLHEPLAAIMFAMLAANSYQHLQGMRYW